LPAGDTFALARVVPLPMGDDAYVCPKCSSATTISLSLRRPQDFPHMGHRSSGTTIGEPLKDAGNIEQTEAGCESCVASASFTSRDTSSR